MATKVETAQWVEVAKTSDLKNGEMKGLTVGNKKILLARLDDLFYATSNVCPHMGATLSEGKLGGTVITCPRHHSQFDLQDGHVIRWTDFTGIQRALNNIVRSPKPLPVYPVKIDGNKVMVELSK